MLCECFVYCVWCVSVLVCGCVVCECVCVGVWCVCVGVWCVSVLCVGVGVGEYFVFVTPRELYDVGSVMLSDEASIICGMLVGLNSMDYNVMMKGEDFDRTVSKGAWHMGLGTRKEGVM